VAAVAWPMQHGTAARLVAFVCGASASPPEIISVLKKRLPAYMVPARIHELEVMPMSGNGKIDRMALARMLDDNLFQ
jgi:D-alanine--poly(phosphoribitol) ligase subunit 1